MTKKIVKLIILDGYGVIFSRGYPDTINLLAKKYKIPAEKLNEVIYKKYCNLAAMRKISQKQVWQYAVRDFSLPVSWKSLADLHLSLLKINQPVFKLIKKLRQNYLIVMLSKNTRSQFLEVKRKYPEVWQNISAAINTWELNLPKASKETIMLIAKKYDVNPAEILYVDDHKENLVEPAKLGVKTIFYQNFSQFRKDLKKYVTL